MRHATLAKIKLYVTCIPCLGYVLLTKMLQVVCSVVEIFFDMERFLLVSRKLSFGRVFTYFSPHLPIVATSLAPQSPLG